jgi:hypothetical protein
MFSTRSSGHDRSPARLPDAFVDMAARIAGALPIYTFDADLRRHRSPVAAP